MQTEQSAGSAHNSRRTRSQLRCMQKGEQPEQAAAAEGRGKERTGWYLYACHEGVICTQQGEHNENAAHEESAQIGSAPQRPISFHCAH